MTFFPKTGGEIMVSVQEEFFLWLSKKVSPAQLSEYCIACIDIEKFCLQERIFGKNLFETTDLKAIESLVGFISSNQVYKRFRATYGHNLSKTSAALKYYCDFLKTTKKQENITAVKNESTAEKISSNKETFKDWLKSKYINELVVSRYMTTAQKINKILKDQNIIYTDLFLITDSKHLEKIKSQIFGKVLFANSIPMAVFNDLIAFRQGKSATEKISTSPVKSEVQAEKKIKKYDETSNKATNAKISIPSVKAEITEIKNIAVENSKSTKDELDANKSAFKDWLKFQYTNKMTALICFETIADINKMLKSEKISPANLFLIADSKKLVEIKDLLLNTRSFKSLNEKQRNIILTAFYSLVKFCQCNSKTEKIPTSAVKSETPQAEKKLSRFEKYVEAQRKHFDLNVQNSEQETSSTAEKIPTPPVKSETSTEKNLSKIDKYAEILNKYFGENGYQPGKIRFRNRFKQFFFEEYGENISDSEEQFEEILKKIGTQRDDRIFPKQDENQNELINDIVNDIFAAFDSGASAVFIEAVYDKYQKPLAENLKVYNADACVPLILENANGKFFKYGTYFNPRIRKAAPVEDILRFLQEIHQPLAYNQICCSLWYIPQSKLKVLLNQIPEVVRVGNDLFFYAPNLPLDEAELQKVSSLIQSEIDFHGYITDVKMMTLIKSKYHMIASNLDEFSTYAVRNCLSYIFNGRFAFNGSVISSLGSQLNLSEVYADFAREHENLTLDELKDFAKELDSNISWFPVLSEMVRVSQNKFVRKDFINFNVNVIDKFLDEMYPQNYIPLKEVTLFINFPNVGYAWNIYLLESYLYSFSRKFRLIHNSFAESGVYGAMVRVGSSISDYESLITDALSYSDSLTESKALQFIVDQGYQQRKTYKDIGNVIRKAKILKENRRRKSF